MSLLQCLNIDKSLAPPAVADEAPTRQRTDRFLLPIFFQLAIARLLCESAPANDQLFPLKTRLSGYADSQGSHVM
jgi:hypothetical protein